eukprot:CAMPEP_0197434478 /NCGR_PEP_ID=MMETSP1175-20131217/2196_1 /TAXON_ID=1003142 /ORGANISM="Triceratium dubium, Strain CCMP147" /LENGTH=356 /DNA_ID=CAMNT_0042963211 /DNA_START=39 /DNA_END=1112 /DNA_ORIENTATION=-
MAQVIGTPVHHDVAFAGFLFLALASAFCCSFVCTIFPRGDGDCCDSREWRKKWSERKRCCIILTTFTLLTAGLWLLFAMGFRMVDPLFFLLLFILLPLTFVLLGGAMCCTEIPGQEKRISALAMSLFFMLPGFLCLSIYHQKIGYYSRQFDYHGPMKVTSSNIRTYMDTRTKQLAVAEVQVFFGSSWACPDHPQTECSSAVVYEPCSELAYRSKDGMTSESRARYDRDAQCEAEECVKRAITGSLYLASNYNPKKPPEDDPERPQLTLYGNCGSCHVRSVERTSLNAIRMSGRVLSSVAFLSCVSIILLLSIERVEKVKKAAKNGTDSSVNGETGATSAGTEESVESAGSGDADHE